MKTTVLLICIVLFTGCQSSNSDPNDFFRDNVLPRAIAYGESFQDIELARCSENQDMECKKAYKIGELVLYGKKLREILNSPSPELYCVGIKAALDIARLEIIKQDDSAATAYFILTEVFVETELCGVNP